VPANAWRGLTAFVKSLGFTDPNKLKLRLDGCPPHPHLAIKPGAVCRQCAFRSTSLVLVRRHLAKVHGMKSNRQAWLRDSIWDDLAL